jgi:hypothetical protein
LVFGETGIQAAEEVGQIVLDTVGGVMGEVGRTWRRWRVEGGGAVRVGGGGVGGFEMFTVIRFSH